MKSPSNHGLAIKSRPPPFAVAIETQQLLLQAHELLQQCNQVQGGHRWQTRHPGTQRGEEGPVEEEADLIGQLEAFHARVPCRLAPASEKSRVERPESRAK